MADSTTLLASDLQFWYSLAAIYIGPNRTEVIAGFSVLLPNVNWVSNKDSAEVLFKYFVFRHTKERTERRIKMSISFQAKYITIDKDITQLSNIFIKKKLSNIHSQIVTLHSKFFKHNKINSNYGVQNRKLGVIRKEHFLTSCMRDPGGEV